MWLTAQKVIETEGAVRPMALEERGWAACGLGAGAWRGWHRKWRRNRS